MTTVKIIVKVLQCVNDSVRSQNIFPETELICTEQFEMLKVPEQRIMEGKAILTTFQFNPDLVIRCAVKSEWDLNNTEN